MAKIKRWIRLIPIALALLLTMGSGAAFAASNSALYIQDEKVGLNRHLLTADGVTFAPAKELADLMGWQLSYDGDKGRVTVGNALGDSLTFKTGSSQIVFDGQTYDIPQTARLADGTAYFPLRTLAEAMHATVGLDADGKVISLANTDPYTVQQGDTLHDIAVAYGTTSDALKARNGLPDDTLTAGQTLKVIVPEFLDPVYDDAALLAKLVQVEAGYEPYAGKLAVANVVVNRANSGRFPDSVSGVIYAAGQFPPALNGELQGVSASAESLQAARAALAGENNVPGAVYFFNPKLEPNKAKTLAVVKKIGNHMFAK